MKKAFYLIIGGIIIFLTIVFLLFRNKLLVKGATQHTTGQEVRDIDGNLYGTVAIGNRLWLDKDLQTSRFNDSTEIKKIAGDVEWAMTNSPAFCWYKNSEGSKRDNFGALYNWYVVEKKRICPTGWHVPGYNEWIEMINKLGGEKIAGQLLKEKGNIHWMNNSKTITASGFNALPSGYRFSDGNFFDKGQNVTWWTSVSSSAENAWAILVSYAGNSTYAIPYYRKNHGFSIRCVKDTYINSNDSSDSRVGNEH